MLSQKYIGQLVRRVWARAYIVCFDAQSMARERKILIVLLAKQNKFINFHSNQAINQKPVACRSQSGLNSRRFAAKSLIWCDEDLRPLIGRERFARPGASAERPPQGLVAGADLG